MALVFRPWIAVALSSLLPLVAVACSLDEAGLPGTDDATPPPADVFVPDDGPSTDDATSDTTPPDAPPDVVTDGPTQPCNLAAPFSVFSNVNAPVDTGAEETSPSLTSDELTMFFARNVSSAYILFATTRPSRSQPWATPTQVTSVAVTNSSDTDPSVVDGLGTLLFASLRGGAAHYDLYSATGDGTINGWSNVTPLAALSSSTAADYQPFWASNVPEIWFASTRTSGQADLWVSTSLGTAPSAAASVDDPQHDDTRPVLSHDGLTLYFARADGSGRQHVWQATRGLTSGPFGTPVLVTDFDSAPNDSNLPGWLSVDGCRMFFISNRGGGKGSFDLWLASRP